MYRPPCRPVSGAPGALESGGFLVRHAWTVLLAVLLAPPCAAAEPGFFRVTQIDGRAFLLDPDGQPFFSAGVDVFHTGSAPEQYDPRRPEYAGLRHHAGFEAWCATERQRLRDWGFNTLGAWAEPRAADCAGLAYTVCLHLGQWVGVPWIDPLSPRAQASLKMLIEREVLPRRDDRRLLGFFVDNELRWYAGPLFSYWASEPSSERLKRALVALLEEHYRGDLAALRADFDLQPRPRRFADLARPLRRAAVRRGRRPEVLERFVGLLAEEYYRAVARAVRAADPHHLLLGDRYASAYAPAVARAAGAHMDVVSVNYAGNEPGGWVSPAFLDTLHRLTGRPLLLGEIYVAARENRSANGNRHGPYLVVDTQRERAATAEALAERLARLPYVVGYHWFQWSDQPSSGREDGEDFNMGLVDLDDRPYEELTQALARVNARAAELHRAGPLDEGLARRDGEWLVPSGRGLLLDGDLREWRHARHWAPGSRAAADRLPFGDFYLAWQPEGLLVGLDYHDADLAQPGRALGERRRLVLRAGAGPELFVVGFDESAGGGAAPLVAVDGAGRRVAGPGGRQRQRSLRTTAELLLPAGLFGRERLEPDQVLELTLALALEGDARRQSWPGQPPGRLRLAPAAAP